MGKRSLSTPRGKIKAEQVDRPEDEEDRPRRRHPGDFDDYPTDEQMEYFKRGGR